MTSPPEPNSHQDTYSDATGTRTDDQKPYQVVDTEKKPDSDIFLVNEEENGIYDAIIGDTKIGGITYSLAGDRIVLLAAMVYPEFRRRGLATRMIRQVLDDVRAHGKTVTIICPIVRTFIDKHPQYEDLVDPQHPGVKSAGQR
jgi:predicted GNAT family acetyltransferase